MLIVPNPPLTGQGILASDQAAIIRSLKNVTPRSSPGSLVITGSGGHTRRALGSGPVRRWPLAVPSAAFNWKMYKVLIGTNAYIQVNGGDGFMAGLNGFTATIDGNPVDTKTGFPPAYPLLPVIGNGLVYAKATATGPGSLLLASLPITLETSVPLPDTNNPPSYFWRYVGNVTNYIIDSVTGVPGFDLNNASNYGWTDLVLCGPAYQTY